MQMRLDSLVFILLSSIIFQPVCAQTHYKETAQIEQHLAYFRLQAAQDLIPTLSLPSYRVYYRCNILIYQFLSTQDPQYLRVFNDNWNKELSSLSDMAETDPLKEIFLADLHAKRAAIAFINQNFFSALRYARNSRKFIQQHQKKYGDHIEQMKIRGLFNVLFGSLPSKYQWIAQALGYYGDIQLGLKQLNLAASESQLLRMESFMIVCYVQKNMLGQPERALTRLLRARKQSSPNILIDFVLASTYMNRQENEEALRILSHRGNYTENDIFFFPFWDYLLAKAYYFKESHAQAQYYFSRFLKVYQGELLKSDAYFRLGLSLTLSGNYPAGRDFFRLVGHEENGINEDEYATFMAAKFVREEPQGPLLSLFRARNLFDGGYSDRALEILDLLGENYSSLPRDLQVELHYRYGRIYHRLGQNDQAIRHYQKCTEVQTQQQWLQVYAFYYQGEIAYKQERFKVAKTCYEKALTYDNYFYQDGLENRCKVALDNIQKKLPQTSASSR